MADDEIFSKVKYNFDTLANRLRELAFLNKGLRLILKDERDGNSEEFYYKGGLVEFIKYIDQNRTALHKPIYISGEREGVEVEIAFEYNDSYSDNIFSYCNNVNTIEGGTHLHGFKSALTRTLNNYGNKNNLLKNIQLQGEDVREGLTAVVSVKVAEPQFEGQTKTKLGNSEVRGVVESIFNEQLSEFLEQNPTIARRSSKRMPMRLNPARRPEELVTLLDEKRLWRAMPYQENWPIAVSMIPRNAKSIW